MRIKHEILVHISNQICAIIYLFILGGPLFLTFLDWAQLEQARISLLFLSSEKSSIAGVV
jgi:hypothetical protein